MTKQAVGLSLILFAARWAAGQPAFEVASVKVSRSTTRPGVEVSPGSLTIDGSLHYILGWGFDVKGYQVTGPGWLASERYRIAAKPAAPSSPVDLRRMLQTLLAERLKLAFHRETKELPVYALVVGKNGPRLTESKTEGEPVTTNNPKRVGSGGTSVRTSMAHLADLLDGSCPDPVVDRTGLTGRYDFTLDLSSYLPGIQPGDLPVILNEALQKQLGLGLEQRRVAVEMLIVDHIEKVPVEN
jgi:uncharacterized protein (TIGR03435 family)